PITNYSGTVHLTSTDLRTGPLSDYTFTPYDRGSHTFYVPLYTAGAQSVTVVDTHNANARATLQPAVQVQPGPTAFFGASYYGNSTYGEAAGYSFPPYLDAEDRYNNITPAYACTVHSTSSDPAPHLPAAYTVTPADQGVHLF